MIDVLTIVSPNTPKGWLQQCRQSVASAISSAGFKAQHVETPFVSGSVGKAMYQGLKMSSANYIAWVDDDDWVLPNALSCMARHLASSPTAICAREIRLYQNGHAMPCDYRHHLTLWRRDILESAGLDKEAAYPLVKLLRVVEKTAVDEMSWVYFRRRWKSPATTIRATA